MREARELSDGGMLYVFEPAVQLSIKLAGVHWWVTPLGLPGGGGFGMGWNARSSIWLRKQCDASPGLSTRKTHVPRRGLSAFRHAYAGPVCWPGASPNPARPRSRPCAFSPLAQVVQEPRACC